MFCFKSIKVNGKRRWKRFGSEVNVLGIKWFWKRRAMYFDKKKSKKGHKN